jgi:hypothetical protein
VPYLNDKVNIHPIEYPFRLVLLKKGAADAKSRLCHDCARLRGNYVGKWWCTSKEAIARRGTSTPRANLCPNWASPEVYKPPEEL